MVRQRNPGPDGTEILVADLTVAYKVIRESFTSRVILDKPEPANPGRLSATARFGTWRTAGLSARFRRAAREIRFFIAYEFKSRTLGLLMGAMFDVVFRSYASAFEKRADLIYARAAQA